MVFIRVRLVFTRVPLVFIRVPSVFTHVPLVFIRVPSVFTRVLPSVFTRGHLCWIGVHSCSDLCGVLDMILVEVMFLQNASIMQVFTGNAVMRISVVKMVCECFTVMTGKPALDFSSVF